MVLIRAGELGATMAEGIHPLEALLLRQWGWKQEPPITTTPGVARALKVSPTTVYNWFNGTAQPDHKTLVSIARQTSLPLHNLLAAAGYDVPPDPDSSWDWVLAQVREAPGLDDERRAALLRDLQDIRRLLHGASNALQLVAC